MSRSVVSARRGAARRVGASRAAGQPGSRARGAAAPAVALATVAGMLASLCAVADPASAVQGYRIDDWKALSSDSLIIRTNDGKRYRATLMGKCVGLRFTDTIAFVTRGERSVDRYAGIMLPDGSRCYFKTFEAISQPTDKPAASRGNDAPR